jgi:hypothetical protein
VDLSASPRCDFLDPAVCLQPWPNDYFTRPDPTSDTGLRLNLDPLSMPANVAGKPIDPTEFNHADGFSPGQEIVTKVPGLDTPAAFQKTGSVPITDIVRTFDPSQPVVVINTNTLRRQLIWTEIDSNADNPADTEFIIRPAVNFDEGTRYVVALRNLKDAQGNVIPAGPAFRLYRDRVPTSDPLIEGRRAHFESIFHTLRAAGIHRNNLFLAWDFTVASRRNLSERLLHIRNDAFRQLGDTNLADGKAKGHAPTFTIDPHATVDYAPCSPSGCQSGQSDTIARHVEGTFLVPCYLNAPDCPPGSRFNYVGSADGLPAQLPGNTMAANFICNIPRSAMSGARVKPARPVVYGHGLLGSAGEVNGADFTNESNEHNMLYCATNEIGLSQDDLGNVASVLTDLSNFPTIPDRLQQGLVNEMYLGRLMVSPSGFSSSPVFQFGTTLGSVPGVTTGPSGPGVIDTHELYYNGNSQGAILGGALMAVEPDATRGVIGGVGMNYSTLLQRSVDFTTYAPLLYDSYPNQLERQLIFSLIQMLWDRGETNGYAHHITSHPYSDTPGHKILLDQAFGDHQVANVTAEVEARTLGLNVSPHPLDPGRSPDVTPYYGLSPIPAYPFSGSALIPWDIGPLRTVSGQVMGTPAPPTTNTPPAVGVDPHGKQHREVRDRNEISAFLEPRGNVIDVCNGHPCYELGWTGAG